MEGGKHFWRMKIRKRTFWCAYDVMVAHVGLYELTSIAMQVGLLRLRKASPEAFRQEMKGYQCSLVRELHVYGSAVPVHTRDPSKFQHKVLCDRAMYHVL